MANNTPVLINEFEVANSVASNSQLLVLQSNTVANTQELKLATVSTLMTNIDTISVNTFIVKNKSTPSNSTINKLQGTIWFDDNYIYVTTSNNITKRISLSSF